MIKEEQQIQDQILTLLRDDRERGAELLLETYTPLLWSVCQRRLSDPEDVKECVDDVFTDFCLNPEKYDPEQTSLKNYLAMLADRRTISYYRKNIRRTEAENAAADPSADAPDDLALELEEALSKLKPEDAQIIRMKYYDGMTYREIAQQLGISEEAVKKRGTRSLSKLAKWLIIGLVLASILAGCAYVVHRYFRYSKGVGLVWGEDTSVYQLAETPEPIIANGVAHHVLSASYSGETLTFWLAHYPADDSIFYPVEGAPDIGLYASIRDLYWWVGVNGDSNLYDRGPYTSDFMSQCIISLPREAVTVDDAGKIRLQLQLVPEEETAERIRNVFGYEADMSVLSWDVILEETEVLQDPADLGYYLSTPYADLLVMTDMEYVSQTEDTLTMVTLYPQYKEDGFKLSEFVSTWHTMMEGFDMEYPTLTDAEGNSYPIYRTMSSSPDSIISAYTLCFQNVPPGEYMLNLPSLCYQVDSAPHTFTLSLPKEDDVSLSCDETFTLAKDTIVRITGVTRSTTHETGQIFPIESWVDGVQNWELVEDSETFWEYGLNYQVTDDESFPLCGIFMAIDFYHMTESGPALINVPSQMDSSTKGLDGSKLGIRDGLGMDAPDLLTITIEKPYYLDVQSYSIPITIK